MEKRITAYCKIKNQKLIVNGNLAFKTPQEENFLPFLTLLYRNFQVDYPKFFKMDALSKLAFLTSHFLLHNSNFLQEETHPNTALIINNSSSSLTVDKQYQLSTEDFPAPSLFVYTLPNVMLGEICIRYKIYGENSVFISQSFNIEQLIQIIKIFDTEKTPTDIIAGYIEQNGENYESFLMLIEKSEQGIALTAENVKELYHLNP